MTSLRLSGLVLGVAFAAAANPPTIMAQTRPDPAPSGRPTQDAVPASTLKGTTIEKVKGKGTLNYQSTFDQYKPYTDEKVSSWRSSNDEVGRIGGWRAYLKEANEPESVEPSEGKSPVDKSKEPSQPRNPAPTRSTNPHSGHGGKP